MFKHPFTVRHNGCGTVTVKTMPEAIAKAIEWESLGFRPVLIETDWTAHFPITAASMEWEDWKPSDAP